MIAINYSTSVCRLSNWMKHPSACYPACVVRGRKNPGYLTLPTRLKKARKAAQQSRLATMQQAGFAHSTLAGWEEGERIPRIDAVEKVAYALSLSPVFLAFGVQREAGPPARGLRSFGMAQRLADSRAARGLSVLAVAKMAGLSHTAVGNVERGTMPTLATAEALANALGLSAGWLAFGIGPRELPPRRRAHSVAQTAP